MILENLIKKDGQSQMRLNEAYILKAKFLTYTSKDLTLATEHLRNVDQVLNAMSDVEQIADLCLVAGDFFKVRGRLQEYLVILQTCSARLDSCFTELKN